MRKLRILVILGTRPEIIRLSSLLRLLDQQSEMFLLHTGQNFTRELSDVFFENLELRLPDRHISARPGSLSEGLASTFLETERVVGEFRPDATVILGDTNSALAAIVSERMSVPVFHLEAGNRSFDPRVPEELNRRIVDHASTFNLPYSNFAERNLLREGLDPNKVCVTGTPLHEVLEWVRPKLESSKILEQLELLPGEYFLVSSHRQETVDSEQNLLSLVDSLEQLFDTFGKRVIVSTHPRTRARLDKLAKRNSKIEYLDPFGYVDFLKLQISARCVLSDSGTISEESSILNFKAITIRDSFERQEVLSSGLISTAGLNFNSWRIALDAIEKRPNQLASVYPRTDYSFIVWQFMLSKLLPSMS